MKVVRTRIAPSPTGEDLHIGNVYTALLNYIFARKSQGKFIVRIEDTDRTRLVKGAEEKILSSLQWFGLTPDESPKIGGPYAPYRQSERLDLYKKYALELVEKGHAFYCFCTPERLAKMREDQQKKGLPPMYDGHCKKLQTTNYKLQTEKARYVIRLNVPDEGVTEFTDLIRGKISFENKLIDDQVLLKSDGFPTYHLGVVVDDHLMEISHVIRAEEWISSTPKHILIYKFLGWELPIFAHGPILRNPDRSKLSKRKNPVWASWYKEQGYLPEAILNYLALMGWSPPEGKEIFSLDEMMKYFQLEDVKPVGPAFDLTKLEWMNGEYIRKKSIRQLADQILEFYEDKNLPDKLVEKTVPLIQERIKKLSDYLPLTEFFFKHPEKYDIDLSSKLPQLSQLVQSLEKVDDWKADVLGKTMQDLVAREKYKSSNFFMTVRVAVTGKKISPPLNESMEILGKEETLERLKKVQST
ncbi:glutamate--tRNA ligase [Candidatus Gottesmanbacteria bacterium RIFCSPHIGHO2_01_FULL_39_10]|uniref:Glutamate--tRNA ligase n=1 Tax=Candidatus Gottesmanbacteria bacterium RIFCSPHIGHO2_01_FULL_39_10 TaxID=1798375 RepID=A0A1F5ZSQ4_9BACT|nr:MAG: glutamate--tRNA ligase [Candidatus Gottesmanbacteria bacterium RIFCSPHIGHO2_01_FULL_39_10]